MGFYNSESIHPTSYEHEIFCAYRFHGEIKHTTCSSQNFEIRAFEF